MPRQVAAYVAQWQSSTVRGELAKLTRRIVQKTFPQSIPTASNRLQAVAPLIAHLARAGRSLSAATPLGQLFDETAIASFEQSLNRQVRQGQITAATRRTWLSRVVQVAKLVASRSAAAQLRGHTRRTSVVSLPMPDTAVVQWEHVADAQSPSIGRQLRCLLYCCRGAGAGSSDLRHLRGSSVHRRRDGTVVLDIPGPGQRLAVVLDRYGNKLHDLAHGIGDDLLIGAWPNRSNPVSGLLDNVLGGRDLPRPLPRSLRRAYVLEMLQTPGLETLRLFEQLGRNSLSELENALALVPRNLFGDSPLRTGSAA